MTTLHNEKALPPSARAAFLFAGRAIFTLTSKRTGASYTYKIEAGRNAFADRLFASVLTGPDNTSDYATLGMLGPDRLTVRSTRNSSIAADAPSAQALAWFLRNVTHPDVEVRHAGCCGRCGRLLTTPESIDRGLGPDCATR